MDNFLDDSAGSSDSNILVAARTILVQLEPILDAALAKKLITVVTFLGLTADFKANLAKDKSCEFFTYFEASNTIWIIACQLSQLVHSIDTLFT